MSITRSSVMTSLIFLITAALTGHQAIGSMIRFVCGRGGIMPHPPGMMALAGALALLISAGLIFIRPFAATVTSLAGCLALLVFQTIGLSRYASAITAGEDYFDIVLFIPSFFLLASTALSVRGVLTRKPPTPVTDAPTDAPTPASKGKRFLVTASSILLVMIAAIGIALLMVDRRSGNARIHGYTPLHEAVFQGDLTTVRNLLKSGANPNALDGSKESVLTLAITKNRIEIMEDLIAAGAEVNTLESSKIKDEVPPLFLAAEMKRLDAVKLLLKHGAKVDCRGPIISQTPLMAAFDLSPVGLFEAEPANLDTLPVAIAEVLLEAGADVNARDKFDFTPLHYAIMGSSPNQMVPTVAMLLARGADVNAKDRHGRAPLDMAGGGDSPLAQLLKSKGARSENIFTALQTGEIEKIKASLDAGLDVNRKYQDDMTLLTTAAKLGKLEVVNFLLEHGADIEVVSGFGTALHCAAKAEHIPVMETLLKHGANVNAKAYQGMTPLHVAAREGKSAAGRVLIEHGADVKLMSDSGDSYQGVTPLDFATHAGAKELVELLLDKGAPVDVGTVDGRTPLMTAALMNRVEIARLLLDRGADVNRRDQYGATALRHASQANQDAMRALLRERGAK